MTSVTMKDTGRKDCTNHKSTAGPVDFQEERKEAQQSGVTKAQHLLGKERGKVKQPQPTERNCSGSAEVHECIPLRQLDYSAGWQQGCPETTCVHLVFLGR